MRPVGDLPTVEAALATMLAHVIAGPVEAVPVAEADGRWLAADVTATRAQPPFDASAMDGWALRGVDIAGVTSFRIVGESAAGRGYTGALGAGETVRISTGAPLPSGADRVVIQEEAARDGDRLTVAEVSSQASYVRPRGCDFTRGQTLVAAGVRLDPWRLALAASAGAGVVTCGAAPRVAILATGYELVEPGRPAGSDQIYDAATPALAALVKRQGGAAHRLPIVGDRQADLVAAVSGVPFDLLLTIGGASVGDHDLIKPALCDLGAVILVEGVAMRPGKPVWFAVLPDGRPVLGLPGNPASALVCAELFLAPLLARLQGGTAEIRFETAILAEALPANGPRDHYLRAWLEPQADCIRRVAPFTDQDSSLVTVMAAANVLVRRAPFAPPAPTGSLVAVLAPSAR